MAGWWVEKMVCSRVGSRAGWTAARVAAQRAGWMAVSSGHSRVGSKMGLTVNLTVGSTAGRWDEAMACSGVGPRVG